MEERKRPRHPHRNGRHCNPRKSRARAKYFGSREKRFTLAPGRSRTTNRPPRSPAPLLHAAEPCRVEIVDRENGWPVPLVELRSTHERRFVSDNAGLIAIDDPDLLDRAVWFHLKGHGYGVKKDGFGYEGIRTSPVAGGSIRIEVERRNIAKRLGRLTSGGLFAEAQKLGEDVPAEASGTFGCDSVLMARHDGKLFWLWGDTSVPGYPLGVFDSTAATTAARPV